MTAAGGKGGREREARCLYGSIKTNTEVCARPHHQQRACTAREEASARRAAGTAGYPCWSVPTPLAEPEQATLLTKSWGDIQLPLAPEHRSGYKDNQLSS